MCHNATSQLAKRWVVGRICMDVVSGCSKPIIQLLAGVWQKSASWVSPKWPAIFIYIDSQIRSETGTLEHRIHILFLDTKKFCSVLNIICSLGRAENTKNSNINLNQMGSNGTHKNKTYLSKEKNSKVHIRIGKCI